MEIIFKNVDYIVLSKKYDNGEIREEETLEIDEVKYSDYANSKIIGIDYSIDLIKSCDTTIEVTPILIIEY